MFGDLTEKFQRVFAPLFSGRTLSEGAISDAVREVRLALLDADVNYGVAKKLVARVKERALGKERLRSVSAADQFVKIVHDELKSLMGGEAVRLDMRRSPSVILLCGLQGSGKTTQAAKLAHYLQKERRNPLLAACDLKRAAAIDQLERLGERIGVPVVVRRDRVDPVALAEEALDRAKREAFDALIIDTAGRIHLDEELMEELERIVRAVTPHEILFVANAGMGQGAVEVASRFHVRIPITGTILTMLDGNVRAGAAISIREETGKPLKFEGMGEGLGDLQLFDPHSMADRVLGMGDVINLVKRAEESFASQEAEKIAKKLRRSTFSYGDFLRQIRALRKMGSLKKLLQMVPGYASIKGLAMSDREIVAIEAMILSMTPLERLGVEEFTFSRRRRVAFGSGNSLEAVNRMVKGFKWAKQMMKKMPGFKREIRGAGDLEKGIASLSGLRDSGRQFFKSR